MLRQPLTGGRCQVDERRGAFDAARSRPSRRKAEGGLCGSVLEVSAPASPAKTQGGSRIGPRVFRRCGKGIRQGGPRGFSRLFAWLSPLDGGGGCRGRKCVPGRHKDGERVVRRRLGATSQV